MSTPSAKPFGFAGRSTRDPQSNAEQSNVEIDRVEDEPVRSPYAPKVVHGGNAADPVRGADDVSLPPRFLLSSRQAANRERGLTDFAESDLQFQEGSEKGGIARELSVVEEEFRRRLPQSSPAQAGAARQIGSDDRPFAETHDHHHAAAARGYDGLNDDELRRLEDSVRQLQREAATGRARRSDGPPAPSVHSDDGRGQRRRGETYVDGFRVPPSLQPEILPAPPERRAGRGRLQTFLSVLLAGVVAAPIAYYLTAGDVGQRPVPETTLASAVSQPVAPASVPIRTERIPVPEPGSSNPETSAESQDESPVVTPGTLRATLQGASQGVSQGTAQTASQAASQVTVVPRQTPTPSAEMPASPPPKADAAPPAPARVLPPPEIDVLVKQGQQFIAAGDFVTARVVFQRAAEAGNAAAALALGASYDPVVLANLGVRGIEADVGKARTWYQKAKEFGAPEAARRLDILANR
jgi:hypothetical protein